MDAPGQPGIPPTWTSSAKDLVGVALGPSRLWFTIGYGIVNEVYCPRIDSPQIRDIGFIVADGSGFWVEVKRHNDYVITTPLVGVPAAEIVHRHPRFELRLRIAPDPDRDVLLIEASLKGDPSLKLYPLLAPHLGGTGFDNVAEVFRSRSNTMLCAEQGASAVALACVDNATQRDGWSRASAGYVEASDGWQDFAKNGRMTWSYPQAGPGNVALMGEAATQEVTLALAFGPSREGAATLASSALRQTFESVWTRHVASWATWQSQNVALDRCEPAFQDMLKVSAMILHAHQDKTFPGAMVASLSIPWGNSNNDTGGYHLVWPRDIVESAGALVALGAHKEARDVLRYLLATQLADGRWCQNQWLSGEPHWSGIQLDEVAFPILLASALAEAGALNGIAVRDMVEQALRFIVLNGPSTEQDRWEETPGVNAFTLAIAIAAMVSGADLIDPDDAEAVRALADDWNAHVEDWLTATNPALCAAHGVKRYYVRSTPPRIFRDPAAIDDLVPVRNHAGGLEVAASTLVSTDVLQLVRFGLRQPDDPIVMDSLKVIDDLLKVDLPTGASWKRYNSDGYGEHDDGAPYDGAGKGRPWPLLTGERGHYALCAGDHDAVRTHLAAMTAMSGKCGMLPEQVWDADPIPALNLHPGHPSGSAMPLVWAHGEFVKLALSLKIGAPVDRPAAVWDRYRGVAPTPTRAHWSRMMPVGVIAEGQSLRFIFEKPTLIHWSLDGWSAPADVTTAPGVLGLSVADLPAKALAGARLIRLAMEDLETGEWWETDTVISIAASGAGPTSSARVAETAVG
jgi:glucoamylase